MSYRVFMWTVAAVLLVSVITAVDLTRERRAGPVFVASNGPISEEQVRQKMTADGWTNVQIKRDGRYFQVVGSKDQTSNLTIDSQTGRLRGGDDDED
jgi:hypothetical protein